MEKKQERVDKYGLIGKDIGYSFSRSFFKSKFEKERINASYQNFDCVDYNEIREVLKDRRVKGFNVTIPYKEKVISLIDELDIAALEIGAVNTIKRLPDGRLKGYNTDYIGFTASLLGSEEGNLFKKILEGGSIQPQALIFGTGGASKAVVYALEKMGVKCQYISRKRSKNALAYDEIDEELVKNNWLFVNCTPLGTFPEVDIFPDLPYEYLDESHIVYDLIYNPPETTFLRKARAQGASTFNGLAMLEGQALASWEIWQSL